MCSEIRENRKVWNAEVMNVWLMKVWNAEVMNKSVHRWIISGREEFLACEMRYSFWLVRHL